MPNRAATPAPTSSIGQNSSPVLAPRFATTSMPRMLLPNGDAT
jgi:hypothetical protein